MMFNITHLAILLLIVGGLNCGSIGIMGKDFITGVLGRGMGAKALHIAIGLAAVYAALRLFGFMEGFENAMNENMLNEGFDACGKCKDEKGGACVAKPPTPRKLLVSKK
jgi:uncharacterized membrane protein YuzA (DUF378 family)